MPVELSDAAKEEIKTYIALESKRTTMCQMLAKLQSDIVEYDKLQTASKDRLMSLLPNNANINVASKMDDVVTTMFTFAKWSDGLTTSLCVADYDL